MAVAIIAALQQLAVWRYMAAAGRGQFPTRSKQGPTMAITDTRDAGAAFRTSPIATPARRILRKAPKIRLSLPSTDVPLFHAWRP
jgi:hypothetical protein